MTKYRISSPTLTVPQVLGLEDYIEYTHSGTRPQVLDTRAILKEAEKCVSSWRDPQENLDNVMDVLSKLDEDHEEAEQWIHEATQILEMQTDEITTIYSMIEEEGNLESLAKDDLIGLLRKIQNRLEEVHPPSHFLSDLMRKMTFSGYDLISNFPFLSYVIMGYQVTGYKGGQYGGQVSLKHCDKYLGITIGSGGLRMSLNNTSLELHGQYLSMNDGKGKSFSQPLPEIKNNVENWASMTDEEQSLMQVLHPEFNYDLINILEAEQKFRDSKPVSFPS